MTYKHDYGLSYHLKDKEKVFLKVFDWKKTLEEMKKLYEELDPKMPENYAELVIVNGHIQSTKETVKNQNLGVVSFIQLKAKDKSKIEEAKADLVERLKEVDGPCLSFDAPKMFEQMVALYDDAPKLIEKYGDVLRSPMWKTRLFRLDP